MYDVLQLSLQPNSVTLIRPLPDQIDTSECRRVNVWLSSFVRPRATTKGQGAQRFPELMTARGPIAIVR